MSWPEFSNSPALLDESGTGASGTLVVKAAGDGETEASGFGAGADLFFATFRVGAFLVDLVLAFFVLFLATTFEDFLVDFFAASAREVAFLALFFVAPFFTALFFVPPFLLAFFLVALFLVAPFLVDPFPPVLRALFAFLLAFLTTMSFLLLWAKFCSP